jgi:hypothetical protein
VVADQPIIAEHPRRGAARLVIDPAHYERPATDTVLPPTPLGRLSARLQAITAMPVALRPMDFYADLAEVAR